jgi:hypothetical protein
MEGGSSVAMRLRAKVHQPTGLVQTHRRGCRTTAIQFPIETEQRGDADYNVGSAIRSYPKGGN